MTRVVGVLTSASKRVQRRRAEVDCIHDAYEQVFFYFMHYGGGQSRLVPKVEESKDPCFAGRDIQNDLLLPPPKNRSLFASRLGSIHIPV
jgi:hypothetical protein